jgi:hypothetical protein
LGHWFSEYWVAASWPKDQTTGPMSPYRYARARFSRSSQFARGQTLEMPSALAPLG